MLVLKYKIGNDETIIKVKNFPFTIGRSIKNSLILNDDSISAHHAVISQRDDGLFIKDLESTNGLLIEGNKIKESKIEENLTLKLGDIGIQILFDEEELDKTRVIKLPEEILNPNKIKSWHINLAAALVLLMGIILTEYITGPLRKESVSKIILNYLAIMITILSWTGIASLISKVHSKIYKFKSFFSISVRLVAIAFATGFILDFVKFQINAKTLAGLIHYVYSAVIAFVFLYLNMEVFFQGRFKKIIVIGISGLFILVGGLSFMSKSLDDRETNFSYNSPLLYTWANYGREDYPFDRIQEKLNDSIEEVSEYREEDLKKQAELLKEYDEAIK